MKKLLIFTSIIGMFVLGFYFYFHNVGRIRPVVNEIFVVSADVPTAFDGIRVVQISDLLVRSENCLILLESVVEEVNNVLNPEIIVFTGNLFLPEGLAFAEDVSNLLGMFDASLSSLAVLGYHDIAHEELVRDVLEDAGFRVLNNEALQVFNQSPNGINVIGANPTNNHRTTKRLLQTQVDDASFNLLLANSPLFTAVALENYVDIQLSGLCLGTQDATNLMEPCFQFYDGIYQFADHLTLHVSSGLARFHTLSNFSQRPSIDSFLLVRDRNQTHLSE